VWSIELQQMSVVLQSGDPYSPTLLQADLQVTDYPTCNALLSGRLTDRMICAGSPSEVKGPCSVRGS